MTYDKAADAYARSLRIMELKYGKDHPLIVASLLGIADAELDGGRPNAARPHLERAYRHVDAKEGWDEKARLQFLLARALWATPADRARARTLADEAWNTARAGETKDDEMIPLIEAWRKKHVAP